MLSKLQKYGPVNTIDALKALAIITMVIDHLGLFFFPEQLFLRSIGRVSAPIWFFLAGRHSYKVGWPLLLAAIIVQGTIFTTSGELWPLNVLISLIIAKYAVRLLIKFKVHFSAVLFAGFALMFITVPAFEYGSAGIMLAYAGHMQAVGARRRNLAIFMLVAAAAYLLTQTVLFPLYSPYMLLGGILLAPVLFSLFILKDKKLAAPKFLLLGRYSLEIYVVHFLAFLLASMYLAK